ncbi:hypothetical protein FRB90_008535, partial [Tulasnella sp. 427]
SLSLNNTSSDFIIRRRGLNRRVADGNDDPAASMWNPSETLVSIMCTALSQDLYVIYRSSSAAEGTSESKENEVSLGVADP